MDAQQLLGRPVAEQVAWWREQIRADPKLAQDQEVLAMLAELDSLLERNPLQAFAPHPCQQCGTYAGPGCSEHRTPQFDFLRARTRIVAAFAGNRMGKSTGLTVRALVECVDRECLPDSLQQFKRWDSDTAPRGTFGRIVNPSGRLLESVILPSFKQWVPRDQLVGGSWEKAYKGQPEYKLSFVNGSFIEFMTYEMDEDKFGGAARHFIGYDEPPPKGIRRECKFRLPDYDGYEMFACTPLKANTAWMRRDIWRKREHPDITVIKGSIHDNPHLSKAAVKAALEEGDGADRLAREFGDFVEMGGLIYPDFERWVVDRPAAEFVRGLDHVVTIDPGVRNAAILFSGFDRDNVLVAFDEALLKDQTPVEYAKCIRSTLARWGIREDRVTFVIDPAARQRSQVNAETVESALAREGIFCVHGQNDVEAGIIQLRIRGSHKRIVVSRECRLLRDEADEYAAEDREDGVFKPIKTDRMHLLDTLRYTAMHQPYEPVVEETAGEQRLGWEPGHALPARLLKLPEASPPLGSMS